MAQGRQWAFVALTAVLVLAASALVSRSQSSGDAARGNADGASRFTVTSQVLADRRMATVIVDAETMRLLVYAFDFNKNQLRLIAVRDISQDVSLTRYSNLRPWPEDIRKLLEAERRGEDTPAVESP